MAKAIHIGTLLAALVWFAVGPLEWLMDEPPALSLRPAGDGRLPGPVASTHYADADDAGARVAPAAPEQRFLGRVQLRIEQLSQDDPSSPRLGELLAIRNAMTRAVSPAPPDPREVEAVIAEVERQFPPVLAAATIQQIRDTSSDPDLTAGLRELVDSVMVDIHALAAVTSEGEGDGLLANTLVRAAAREMQALWLARLHAIRQEQPHVPRGTLERLEEAVRRLQRVIESQLPDDDRPALLRELHAARSAGDWSRVRDLAERLKEYDMRLSADDADGFAVKLGNASYHVFIEGDGSVVVVEKPPTGDAVTRHYETWDDFRQALPPVAFKLEAAGNLVEIRQKQARERAVERDRQLVALARCLAAVCEARVNVESSPGADGTPVTNSRQRVFPPDLLAQLADRAMELADAATTWRETVVGPLPPERRRNQRRRENR